MMSSPLLVDELAGERRDAGHFEIVSQE